LVDRLAVSQEIAGFDDFALFDYWALMYDGTLVGPPELH